jgi:hypothetical protein
MALWKKKMEMSEEDFLSLQYPIGKYQKPDEITSDHIKQWKKDISELPYQMRKITAGIRERDLDKTYRPDGWTARQVIHHVADSHMNAYIRFKWALTEDVPMIKAYDEGAWAKLYDSTTMNVDISMKMIDALHTRWSYLLDSLKKKDWARSIDHPEYDHPATLDSVLGMYSWHGKHHTAHLNIVKEQLKY